MRISPLSFTLLWLLVLVVVSTADAKRRSRVGGAAALKKKSDFGGKKRGKPNLLRLKLGSGLMKGAAKTGLNRITRNGEMKCSVHTLALFLDISFTSFSSICISIISTWQRHTYLMHLRIPPQKGTQKWIWSSIQYWTSMSANCSDLVLMAIR
uniref:Secreted protein n=1 Tax=Echinococcus canadensis TaxID=519352 RepID=A0A915EX90_9CEST